MENRFLLSCQCGRQLTIDPGQTGQMLTCACGQKVQAPGTLQELRRLPRAKAEEPAPTANWGETARAVFAIGSLLVVVGILASAYFGYYWWTVGETEKPDPSRIIYDVNIETLKPTEILDFWAEAEKGLPQDRPLPHYLFLRQLSARLVLLMSVGGGLIVAGIAACVGASWLAQPQAPRQKP